MIHLVCFFCIDFLPLAGCKEEEFTWTNYLKMTKAQGASKELFASPGRVTVTIYHLCRTNCLLYMCEYCWEDETPDEQF